MINTLKEDLNETTNSLFFFHDCYYINVHYLSYCGFQFIIFPFLCFHGWQAGGPADGPLTHWPGGPADGPLTHWPGGLADGLLAHWLGGPAS